MVFEMPGLLFKEGGKRGQNLKTFCAKALNVSAQSRCAEALHTKFGLIPTPNHNAQRHYLRQILHPKTYDTE